MSTNKITSSDYDIYVGPYTANNWSGTMTVHGNLAVQGNITYIHTQDLTIDDPFITVAGNNSGTFGSAAFPDQGLVAQTSATTYAGIRFDNTANTWQISSLVEANGAPISAYSSLATLGLISPGGSNTSIQFNDGSSFGGTANLVYDKVTNQVTLQGYLTLGNIGTTPTATSNAATLYNKQQNSGGTGVFVKSSTVDTELIGTGGAILYSLIF